MNDKTPRRGTRFALTFGLMAFIGGLWLFLDSQDFGLPPFREAWPGLLLIAAVAAWIDFLALSRRPGSAGWGMFWIGFTILGFALSLGHTRWTRILDWLPGIPAICGVSLLVTWLAGRRRDENQLVAGGILIALALVGFAARHDLLLKILPSAQVIWAFLLVAVGGFLVWRSVKGTRD